ncbi:DUF2189 domain-containing protein [Oceanomicrobium pacificus]|uniref:DUF2189 domain-containing protein n=1 Tax=Oceanomicrobium pacificus TaxID=2692916 RepID=A0A6B0TJT7_9RHOB|nr:DUF2189 domain-containing protein [Oceanomicrobium pacificus]MXU64126.1 DUF2189 domain-containing protein [Oceanomicrobium pacificus]
MTDTTEPPVIPDAQAVTTADLTAALAAGWRDFLKAPMFGIVFGALFSVIGITIYLQLVVQGSSYWILPLACGFPLVGPFLAVGLYEVSRELEAGQKPTWPRIFRTILGQSQGQVPSMAFVVLFFYLVWVYLAHLVFALSFGLRPLTNVMTSADLLFSPQGITMLLVGTIVGGALAALLFAVTVMAVPMIVDRDVDVVTAMIRSFTFVRDNAGTMALWAVIVVVLSILGSLPGFLGMILVFPVLGHATWHLYRRAYPRGDG